MPTKLEEAQAKYATAASELKSIVEKLWESLANLEEAAQEVAEGTEGPVSSQAWEVIDLINAVEWDPTDVEFPSQLTEETNG